VDESTGGVDLSGLHRELDKLKAQLCRCNHSGECLACRGFEILRQQSQTVVAAASQPVLMQVAQEVAVKDLVEQLGGVSEKLTEDPRVQELMGELMERIQEDLGGPEAMQQLMQQFGGLGGMPGFPGADQGKMDEPGRPPDDRPPRRPYDDLGPEERTPHRS
jgi:hypothetical protein